MEEIFLTAADDDRPGSARGRSTGVSLRAFFPEHSDVSRTSFIIVLLEPLVMMEPCGTPVP